MSLKQSLLAVDINTWYFFYCTQARAFFFFFILAKPPLENTEQEE